MMKRREFLKCGVAAAVVAAPAAVVAASVVANEKPSPSTHPDHGERVVGVPSAFEEMERGFEKANVGLVAEWPLSSDGIMLQWYKQCEPFNSLGLVSVFQFWDISLVYEFQDLWRELAKQENWHLQPREMLALLQRFGFRVERW